MLIITLHLSGKAIKSSYIGFALKTIKEKPDTEIDLNNQFRPKIQRHSLDFVLIGDQQLMLNSLKYVRIRCK